MRYLLNFLILAVIPILASCATWMEVSGGYTSSEYDYLVELPKDWMKKNQIDFLLITRDGIPLQNIILQRYSISHEFKNSKKKLAADMSPQEVAEVILDDIASNTSGCQAFQILENAPAVIDGEKGFRIIFSYQNSRNMRYKSVYYGFLSGDYFYGIQYTAAKRYYYDKDLQTFEAIVNSFKRTGKT